MWYATSTRPGAGGGLSSLDPNLRVSDAERSEVADTLSKHYGEGRLSAEELDERLSLAMSAKTRGDLIPLLADLPAPEPEPAARPSPGERLVRNVRPVLATGFCVALALIGAVLMVVHAQTAVFGFFLIVASLMACRRWRRAHAWRLWHDHLHEHGTPHWHGPRGPVVYEPGHPGWPWPPGGPNPPYAR
jgi:hypothetical protein